MKKKIVWLGVSWLIVAALVLASCGPAAPLNLGSSIITVKIENVSNRRRRLEGEKRFSISDSEGNTYLYHQYLGENPILTPPYLHVGDEIEGKMLFNIPEGASGLKIAYTSKTPPTENKLLAEWVIE